MAEHEQWQQGDAVWRWLIAGPSGEVGCWIAGIVKEYDWMAEEARVCVVPIYDGIANPSGSWVACNDLRRRDPAKDGADRPTAESEAQR